MEKVEKIVVESLDGIEIELFPYLPYILQDLWELGSDPSIMLSLIKENIENKKLKVLDLGCGKGAVSISIAKELQCSVKGIDAIPEFIASATEYAKLYRVNDICEFETGDIRAKINEIEGFDIIILGAIGPVFGNLCDTLIILTKALNAQGYVLLDDGYIDDKSSNSYNRCLRKSDFYNQIFSAGFEVIQEVIIDKNTIEDSDKSMYESIEKRVNELIIQYPAKKDMFTGYLKCQVYENYMLANKLVCGTWLLKLKASGSIAYCQ
jgi:cyclopropane fatty-acyl-phospholipid synthase-like methyltransferase